MVLALILAVAMTGQFSPSQCEASRADLEFTQAVEGFVQTTAPKAIPARWAARLAALGDESWKRRQQATAALTAALKAEPTAGRWLFWGRRHHDPEIRLRSNAILRRLNPCPTCKGSGQSKNWDMWPCWDCQGTATAWPWSMWD